MDIGMLHLFLYMYTYMYQEGICWILEGNGDDECIGGGIGAGM